MMLKMVSKTFNGHINIVKTSKTTLKSTQQRRNNGGERKFYFLKFIIY